MLSQKCASRQFFLKTGSRAFVFTPPTRAASSENGLNYDGSASGVIIYTYVLNNPLKYIDPKGLSGQQSQPYYYPGPFDILFPGTPANNAFVKGVYQACKSASNAINGMFNEAKETDVTNSAGDEIKRKLVKDQDELLEEANKAAGGSLDDYVEYKPGWWVSPDGKRRIEWNPDGHANTDEGPHVTVRDFNGKRHAVTDKIFIDGQEKY